ncbi:hypothetical protein WKN16_002643 [Vibrio parahaemolyticus]
MAEIKWATRALEGLVIGVGASLAFGIFTEMQLASDRLDAAKSKLNSQDAVNLKLNELIQANAKESQAIRQYLESKTAPLSETLRDLTLKVEKLNKAVASNKSFPLGLGTELNLDYSWKAKEFIVPKELPVIQPTTPWPVQNSYQEQQIDLLQGLIIEQKNIELK